MTHCTVLRSESKSFSICGRATVSEVMSLAMTNTARAIAPRASICSLLSLSEVDDSTRAREILTMGDDGRRMSPGTRIAVVDFGTNSTRLLVADVAGGVATPLERRSEV